MIIDSDDYAAAGIETMVFPGGEPHVKVSRAVPADVVLYAKLRTWLDVAYAAMVMNTLQHRDEEGNRRAFIPHFPGARQDRTDGTAPLTAGFIGALLTNDCDVWTFDAHSNYILRQPGVVANLMPADMGLAQRHAVGVIAPDGGAVGRAEQFRAAICPDSVLLCCSKKRDSASGRLSGYHMPALPRAGHYIVVDDICDGGGTFNLLAEAFGTDPHAHHSTLELWVSHGIFSKGLDAISPLYNCITTTDSWCRLPSAGRLEVVSLAPLLERIANA